jgi:hypothetical protein
VKPASNEHDTRDHTKSESSRPQRGARNVLDSSIYDLETDKLIKQEESGHHDELSNKVEKEIRTMKADISGMKQAIDMLKDTVNEIAQNIYKQRQMSVSSVLLDPSASPDTYRIRGKHNT